jgi:hypothetical protein
MKPSVGSYFTKLMEMGGQRARRPELVQARAFLSANP